MNTLANTTLCGIVVLTALAFARSAIPDDKPPPPMKVEAERPSPAENTGKPSQKDQPKVLYYRNPMGLPDTSPVPKKDSMGMDYIPVYADEDSGSDSSVKISLDKVQRTGVRTEIAKKRPLSRSVKAAAVARYDERSLHSVTLRADSFIEKLFVEEMGARVEKGAPLFRIYSPAMVSAQVDYQISVRSGGLRERTTSLKGAERKLLNLDMPPYVVEEIKRTNEPVMSIDWPAPATGVVLKKNVVEGRMARMGDELFLLADLSKIWVVADVAEQDIGLIQIGQPVRINFRAYPGETFEGKVAFILPELDMATRTSKVRIELANPNTRIRLQMFADVEIDTAAGDEPRLAVPNSAIIESGNRQVVLVAHGEGRFEPRNVSLGIRSENFTEVRSGLTAGENVVVSANFLIDAESNLKAALSSFTADAEANKRPAGEPTTPSAAKAEPSPMKHGAGSHAGSKSQ